MPTEPIIYKTCARCKAAWPTAEFRKNKTTKDGFQAYCRSCQNAAQIRYAKGGRTRLALQGRIFIPPKAKCRRCNLVKFAVEFHRNKSNKNGLAFYCKSCKRTHARNSRLKTEYQIEGDSGYNALMEQQNGGCRICGKRPNPKHRAFHVDHDHVTGKVRGILCKTCNTALGMLGDSVAGLMRAVEYLACFE